MKLMPISVQKAIALSKHFGYEEKRQRGSHLVMQNDEGRLIVIPVHTKEIGIGLIRSMICELGIDRKAYFKALDEI